MPKGIDLRCHQKLVSLLRTYVRYFKTTLKSRIIYGLLGDAPQRPPVPKWKLLSEVRRALSRFPSPMLNGEQSQRGNSFRKLAEHYINVSLILNGERLPRKGVRSKKTDYYHLLFLRDIIICEHFDIFLQG